MQNGKGGSPQIHRFHKFRNNGLLASVCQRRPRVAVWHRYYRVALHGGTFAAPPAWVYRPTLGPGDRSRPGRRPPRKWTQGGASGWLSVACAPDDDKAIASSDFEVPEAGEWKLWVRYCPGTRVGQAFQPDMG